MTVSDRNILHRERTKVPPGLPAGGKMCVCVCTYVVSVRVYARAKRKVNISYFELQFYGAFRAQQVKESQRRKAIKRFHVLSRKKKRKK